MTSGWGRYPSCEADEYDYCNNASVQNILTQQRSLIAYGNGRSYGDSALAQQVLKMSSHNLMLGFDETTGVLQVQSGIFLKDIIEVFVPRGWFLEVTPGTKLITVGGAISSDVHGKNHHIAGCFSESVEEFTLDDGSGEVVVCTPLGTPELFRMTCGGQGLTGIILEAKIRLKPICSSTLNCTSIKTDSLRDTFSVLEEGQGSPYSVAWVDCLAQGDAMGRGHVTLADFETNGNLTYESPSKVGLHFDLPSITLNKFTVGMFNALYYHRLRTRAITKTVTIDSFFYPLDRLLNWNRIYGKHGFVQYQCIFPKHTSYEGIQKLLKLISESGEGSFLAVLKLYGKANKNYLSFPMEGFSLALDFHQNLRVFKLLDQLDQIVATLGGRLYLAKDARVSKEIFEQGYPHIEKFRRLRKVKKLDQKFNSLQSTRLGL